MAGAVSDSDSNKEAATKSWTFLSRTWILAVVSFIYAGIYISAWAITTISVYRPITARTYTYEKNGTYPGAFGFGSKYPESERVLRWARVLQAIVSVLTVPLILAVCSQTAVLVLQGRHGRKMTLRQTMALADKGWTDIGLLSRMVFDRRWKQHASPFFCLALALTCLGALVSPLQEVFVSYKTIKVPGGNYSEGYINALADSGSDNPVYEPTSLHATRDRLMSTFITEPQPRLWTDSPVACVFGGYDDVPCQKAFGGNNLSIEQSFYWADLPNEFQTGLLTQYAPRINHSAVFQQMDPYMWPDECVPDTNQTLYLDYSELNEVRTINFTVCFPRHLQSTTMEGSRKKQSFTEEMYFRVGFSEMRPIQNLFDETETWAHPGHYAARVQMNTTIGFFELPNYSNNLTAGPLLDVDPWPLCTSDPTCTMQYGYLDSNDEPQFGINPLLTTGVAIFGNSSPIALPMANSTQSPVYNCSVQLPLFPLFGDQDFALINADHFCPPWSKENYLWLLLGQGQLNQTQLKHVFEAGAFIATDTVASVPKVRYRWTVTSAPGTDFLVPRISLAGIVVISSLLGIFLLCLLSMVVVNTMTERWTSRLDAFALMQLGAVIHEDLSLEVVSHIDEVTVLDKTPGWIGDTTGTTKDHTAVHTLALGAGNPLSGKYRYQAHRNSQWDPKREVCWGADQSQRSDPTRRNLLVTD